MFEELIGQHKVKSRLDFYCKGKQSCGTIPPLLFNGAKGLGKTEFAKQFAKRIGARLLEINCATIRNDQQFVEQVFIPHIHDQDVTVLFDECHALPKKLTELFLTVFNTNDKRRTSVDYRDHLLEFDFERQTYLFATTDMQKMIDPFKDRMNEINFAPYSHDELGEILAKRVDFVEFQDGVLNEISKTLRGNARSAVKRAVEIKLYCENNNQSSFDSNDWKNLCDTLEIMPYGLTPLEKQVLQILAKRGACTLQMLSAVTGMERQALQRQVEIHLLRENLMRIDGKREITVLGQKTLDAIQ